MLFANSPPRRSQKVHQQIDIEHRFLFGERRRAAVAGVLERELKWHTYALGFDVESFSSSASTHSVRLSHSVQSTQAQRQRWGGVIACLILVHHHTQTHTNLIRKQLVSHLFTITHSHTYTHKHTQKPYLEATWSRAFLL